MPPHVGLVYSCLLELLLYITFVYSGIKTNINGAENIINAAIDCDVNTAKTTKNTTLSLINFLIIL